MTFDLDDPNGLTQTMLQADELKADRYREAAFKKALAHPIPAVSEEFCGVIRELVERA
jgi:hypothetical protein